MEDLQSQSKTNDDYRWSVLVHQRVASRRIARSSHSSLQTSGWPSLLFITNLRTGNRFWSKSCRVLRKCRWCFWRMVKS